MNKIYWLLTSAIAPLLFACAASKPLSREVKVSINSNYEVQIVKDPKGHFVDYFTKEQYKQYFIDALTKQLATNKIVIDQNNYEFAIDISSVVVYEKLISEAVKDTLSKDKGKLYDLTVAELRAIGKVRKTDNSVTADWSADKNDREKLTSLRSASMVASGEQMGPHDWRKKPFDSNIYVVLIGHLGNKSGDNISNQLNRWVK